MRKNDIRSADAINYRCSFRHLIERCLQRLIRDFYRNGACDIYIVVDAEKELGLLFYFGHYLLHGDILHFDRDANLLSLSPHFTRRRTDDNKSAKNKQIDLLNKVFIHTFVEFGSLLEIE